MKTDRVVMNESEMLLDGLARDIQTSNPGLSYFEAYHRALTTNPTARRDYEEYSKAAMRMSVEESVLPVEEIPESVRKARLAAWNGAERPEAVAKRRWEPADGLPPELRSSERQTVEGAPGEDELAEDEDEWVAAALRASPYLGRQEAIQAYFASPQGQAHYERLHGKAPE